MSETSETRIKRITSRIYPNNGYLPSSGVRVAVKVRIRHRMGWFLSLASLLQ
jgi:hypothetical protein